MGALRVGTLVGAFASSALIQRKAIGLDPISLAAMVRTEPFKCPNCGTLYQMVKTEAGPEIVDRQIKCHACGAPLSGRDGQFVLKYFLVWSPGRLRRV